MKLFVGFDMRNSNIKIMNADKAHTAAGVDHLHFSSRIFTKEFFAEASDLLEEYFRNKPTLRNLQAYVILPNEAVGFETFNLPNMSKMKLQQALEAELNNLYEGRQKTRKINKFLLKRGKQYTTLGAFYFDKDLIADIYKLLTRVKVFPASTTYSGNALLNSAYAYMPRLRGKSFIFADIRHDCTEIVVSSKGKTLGVATVPHGTDLLKTDKVESEYMCTDHETGEIAVINARETARAKALTLAEEEAPPIPEGATIEDYAVDPSRQPSEYSGTSQAEAAPADEVRETPADAPADGAPAAEEAPSAAGNENEAAAGGAPEGADDYYESEEDEERRLAEQAKEKLKKVKVYRKMPKRYPKFMLRETPETPEGFRYENFRIIMKWILLYARQAELSEYTASPDQIVVNLPQELYFLLDMANEEQKNGPKFIPFAAADKLPAELKSNLGLVGGMYCSKFNRDGNF